MGPSSSGSFESSISQLDKITAAPESNLSNLVNPGDHAWTNFSQLAEKNISSNANEFLPQVTLTDNVDHQSLVSGSDTNVHAFNSVEEKPTLIADASTDKSVHGFGNGYNSGENPFENMGRSAQYLWNQMTNSGSDATVIQGVKPVQSDSGQNYSSNTDIISPQNPRTMQQYGNAQGFEGTTGTGTTDYNRTNNYGTIHNNHSYINGQ